MKKSIKVILVTIGVILLVPVSLIFYACAFLPNVGVATTLMVNRSADHVRNGEYLVKHVAACMSCHSQRDHY